MRTKRMFVLALIGVAAIVIGLVASGSSAKLGKPHRGKMHNFNSSSVTITQTPGGYQQVGKLKAGSTNGQNSTSVTVTQTLPAERLKLTVVGNHGKCSVSSGGRKTFHFRVTGAQPGQQIMILPFYPGTYNDTTFPSNIYEFYWYEKTFGIYIVPHSGVVTTKSWDCTYGPPGNGQAHTDDPIGGYHAYVINLSTLPVTFFKVVP